MKSMFIENFLIKSRKTRFIYQNVREKKNKEEEDAINNLFYACQINQMFIP